jgi:glycosyltransferase involved in cell wall biosynthesis
VTEADEAAGRPGADGLPGLTYLTVDSVLDGVGTSQILPYVTRLAARGLPVTLHTFERRRAPREMSDVLRDTGAGVYWRAHPFGGRGPAGGLVRVVEGALQIHARPLVHCRSDLPAASALVGRPERWVCDNRSFWLDQRIALGMVRPGTAQARVLRRIERAAAERADAVLTLTAAAIDELARRHPGFDRHRATVVPTCVDLERFELAPFPDLEPVVVMLSGSYNRLYDVDASLRLVARLRRLVAADVRLVRVEPSVHDEAVRDAGGAVVCATFDEMPGEVRAAHVGMSILRGDLDAASIGAAPTKIAEFLACGRPVVVNAGLGDYDRLLPEYHAGVILRGTDDDAFDAGAAEIVDLVSDPATPGRCRALANRHFDLESAVDRLLGVYRAAVA